MVIFRWIKIEENNIYIYNSEADKKAENIFQCSQWIISLKEEAKQDFHQIDLANSSLDMESESFICTSDDCKGYTHKILVALESSIQLGYLMIGTDYSQTIELYKRLQMQ